MVPNPTFRQNLFAFAINLNLKLGQACFKKVDFLELMSIP